MKGKNIGIGILLTLMLTLPMVGANAYTWPTEPDYAEYREAIVDYMKSRHPELESLDDSGWDVGLTDERFWFIRYKGVKTNGTNEMYELEWSGGAKWWLLIDYIDVWETSYYYLDYWDIDVAKVGPGTTVAKPGTYYVPPGESYRFRSVADESDDEDITFRFVHWNITDGDSWWIETDGVLTGVATKNLWITAVFRTTWYSGCRIVYEDGLSDGYMWRDDHVLISVRAVGSSAVNITIVGDYGRFTNVWTTSVRSFCVYFRPYWFIGEYTITVTAVNGSPYLPSYQVAGLD